MRQLSSAVFMSLVVGFAGVFSGCTIGDDTATSPSPSPVAIPKKKQPAVAAPGRGNPVARLIQPTNPDQRVVQVKRGRTEPFNDPFSLVPVTPRFVPPPSPSPSPSVPPSNSQGNLPNIPNEPTEPELPSEPELPPLPEPTLAQAIEVTGVVQLGNGDFRIVLKAPQEQSPRYVRIGDRVSGGQVLVKRVETLGETQVVVLEEVGVEVRRAVGEAAANASETPSASSVLPSSWQSGNKI